MLAHDFILTSPVVPLVCKDAFQALHKFADVLVLHSLALVVKIEFLVPITQQRKLPHSRNILAIQQLDQLSVSICDFSFLASEFGQVHNSLL